MTEKQKAWVRNNKEWLTQYKHAHYLKNKDRYFRLQRQWNDNNPEKVRAIKRRSALKHRARSRRKRRYQIAHDPEFRFKHYLRCRIRLALKGHWKAGKTIELLGCSIEQLKFHLEQRFQSGMTWENYGPVWHIDHKRLCSSFDLSNAEDQKKCFHYSNLQPLFAKDNLVKGHRWNG